MRFPFFSSFFFFPFFFFARRKRLNWTLRKGPKLLGPKKGTTENAIVTVHNVMQYHYLKFKCGSFLPEDACKSDRSRKELSDGCLVAKVGFDAAENETFPVCQKVR